MRAVEEAYDECPKEARSPSDAGDEPAQTGMRGIRLACASRASPRRRGMSRGYVRFRELTRW